MTRGLAIITGAGTGVGRALALQLAKDGFLVLGLGRRPEPLAETRAFDPQRISVVSADVGTEQGRAAVIAALPAEQVVSLLVHNAAVLGPVASLSELEPEAWRAHMAINLDGPLFLTKALLPFMAAGSRILHLSSGAALKAYPGWGAYCTAKAGLHMLSRCLDAELSLRQIRVGSVRPGVVDTPMQEEARSARFEVFPSLPRFIALKENCELQAPERVARFLSWLLRKTNGDGFADIDWDIRLMREIDGTDWVPA